MIDFLEQFLILALPELARAFIDSIYIGVLVISLLILILTLSSRHHKERKKHQIEKKAWVKTKADHYEHFYQITYEFEKLISDFEYLTRKIRKENPDGIESLMLQQFKDKLDELTTILTSVKNAQFPNDRELFKENFSSTIRYLSHVERMTKITREYLNSHFDFEESVRD